jgi:NADP-dependent 3-hydroxy acid dehydrogenase YdfG
VETAPVEDLDRLYQVNLRGPYLLTQAVLGLLKAHRGQVVFLNSTVGLEARGQVAQYAASKHSLRALADSLRDEVNGDGIRVLSLYLGRTATPMQAQVFKNENRDYRPELLLQPEDVATVLINALTLPRTAEVTEIRMRPLTGSY